MTETICYKKNYIKEVHFKVDFLEPIKEFEAESLPDSLRSVIIKNFPNPESSTGVTQQVQISEEGIKSDRKEYHQWIFHGFRKEKTIIINPRFIGISVREYKSYSELYESVRLSLAEICNICGAQFASRVGMRFINIFDFLKSQSDAKKYFSNFVSGHLVRQLPLQPLSRAILIHEFTNPETRIRLQSGFYNPDFPAAIIKNNFVIDIDAFIESVITINEAMAQFEKLHLEIQNLFEKCITEKMRGHLNA